MKKIAILQSNYIPWKGYFDLINIVDEFIIYDDMQYTKNDWRNRNKIKTQHGVQWLTIPIKQDSLEQKIKDTKVADELWHKKHWKTIQQNYMNAKYFKEYRELFENIYLNNNSEFLTDINYKFILNINKLLNINTKISFSWDYNLISGKTERLIDLCKQTKASEYISGPSAKSYIDEKLFIENNIKLSWIDYSGYKEYNQLYPPFEHGVSILDLIFNEGSDSILSMKSFREE